MDDKSETVVVDMSLRHVTALAEIAAASGSAFSEVLAAGVGFALAHASHVYGVTLPEVGECDEE